MTPPASEFTPEKMRVRIAEACGRKRHCVTFDPCSRGGLWVCKHCGESYCCPPWSQEKVEQEWCEDAPIPNYPSDLNACAEMEKVLDSMYGRKIRDYWGRLREIVTAATGNPRRPCIPEMLIHATAYQRSLAFCRVMFPEEFKG